MQTAPAITEHARNRWEERFPDMDITMEEAVAKAQLYKGWKNDTRYLTFVHDRYGFHVQKIVIYGPVAFVVRNDRIVTAMESSFFLRPTKPLLAQALPDPTTRKWLPASKRRKNKANRLRGTKRDRHMKQAEERINDNDF